MKKSLCNLSRKFGPSRNHTYRTADLSLWNTLGVVSGTVFGESLLHCEQVVRCHSLCSLVRGACHFLVVWWHFTRFQFRQTSLFAFCSAGVWSNFRRCAFTVWLHFVPFLFCFWPSCHVAFSHINAHSFGLSRGSPSQLALLLPKTSLARGQTGRKFLFCDFIRRKVVSTSRRLPKRTDGWRKFRKMMFQSRQISHGLSSSSRSATKNQSGLHFYHKKKKRTEEIFWTLAQLTLFEQQYTNLFSLPLLSGQTAEKTSVWNFHEIDQTFWSQELDWSATQLETAFTPSALQKGESWHQVCKKKKQQQKNNLKVPCTSFAQCKEIRSHWPNQTWFPGHCRSNQTPTEIATQSLLSVWPFQVHGTEIARHRYLMVSACGHFVTPVPFSHVPVPWK